MRFCEIYHLSRAILCNFHREERRPAVLSLRINCFVRPDSERAVETIRYSEGTALLLFYMEDFHYKPVKRRIRCSTDFHQPFWMFEGVVQPTCQEFSCPDTAESIISGSPVHPIKLIRLASDDKAAVIVQRDSFSVHPENHPVVPLRAGNRFSGHFLKSLTKRLPIGRYAAIPVRIPRI